MIRWVIFIVFLAFVLGVGFGNKEVAQLLGFTDSQIAAVDTLRDRLGGQIETAIGKGDIAIKQYQNKIQEVKDKLIRVKVARKTYESKLQTRKAELAKLEETPEASEKTEAVRSIVTQMETLLAELQNTETTLESTLQKLVSNLDIVKMKIEVLETKIEMLAIQTEIENYAVQESEVQSADTLLSEITDSLQNDINEALARMEVENLVKQAETL